MNNFNYIEAKVEAFIKKYYVNELLKGAILFFAIGLLYFLVIMFIEYVLWLNTTARSILFWTFILVELALLTKFIVLPLAKLFKLQKGINYVDASKIIGKHFPEVNDKLLNVFQLKNTESNSELLLASIEQKSIELKPIPFKVAVNLKANFRYLKYAAIPVVIILLSLLFGKGNWFNESYKRVVNYKTAYTPPAPFEFFVINEDLTAVENKDFTLQVRTAGDVIPETVEVYYNNETYFLKQKGNGEFEYVFNKPKSSFEFELQANNVTSKPYKIEVVKTPSIVDFQMHLNYPSYLKKTNEILKSSGNALVPEGTKVTWRITAESTHSISLFSKDTIQFKSEDANAFQASKRLFSNLNYTLSTSNSNLKHYENLNFNINVIKDQYPEIKVEVKQDSLDNQSLYFHGKINDDYGLRNVKMIYYPTNKITDKQELDLGISNTNFAEFVTAFPNNLNIEEGVAYSIYFEVLDNDAVHNYKSSKSRVFTFRKRTQEEEEQRNLEEQGKTINDLQKSFDKFNSQEKSLQEITRLQKEKNDLNFNDKKKLESFIERQKEQDQMMKHFNNKLKNNIDEFQKEDKDDPFKEALKKRLDENEERLKKDEQLLKELERLQEKINKEQLTEKLEELAKQNKNKKRSLEQLLELTKRYYVEKKLDQLKEDLMKLAIDQEKLSTKNKEENTAKKQNALNEKFEDYKKQISDLEEESKSLKKPIDIPRDKLEEKEVDEEQKNASEELEKKEEVTSDEKVKQDNNTDENLKKAQESQKKAAKKMMQMSQSMQQAMQASGGEQLQEDVDALRQILDNLVLFSFDQEDLMNQFKSSETNDNGFASNLKKQNNLLEHFEHVDDSLFALSLRNPKLSEQVNKEISEVYYNMEKSLENFADNRVYQGISNQQFAITATNNLADFLSDVLDNMQESLSMSAGQGGSGDMQLPDIIMSQEQLNKMMEEGMKKGEGKPKEGEGKKPGQEQKTGEGSQGSSGENDGGEKNGEGKNGKNGQKQSGEGDGTNEDLNGLLYQIYQEQQKLRNELEERIAKEGLKGNAKNLVRQMENVEMELLNKGFTQQTLQKMMQLKHQLLKLDNATHQQEEDNKRQSKANSNQFKNTTSNQIPTAKQYFNTTEILNKQALPLQPVYKVKVQEYFNKTND
ncbi:DUF4175 family protein [Neotamlana laminarinivorans]|uniref:Glutamyl-tRNA synthetase n=1 Tax=Neotamlana laminarinivorans TaxID=2883124 RepID=A0A9X1HYL5_9FLAO|nr:DUF4175 family protein [Tamlana laminarinivorans]MCB4798295.1 hypothetical protein [Tamlana laminarinivorans]